MEQQAVGSRESKRATELDGRPNQPFSLLYAVDRTHAPTHERTAFGSRVDVGSSGVGGAPVGAAVTSRECVSEVGGLTPGQ